MFTIKDFRLNLIKQRIKKNMSAYELSLRLGKDASYISKVESNGKMSLTSILDVCQILEIEPKQLFEKIED